MLAHLVSLPSKPVFSIATPGASRVNSSTFAWEDGTAWDYDNWVSGGSLGQATPPADDPGQPDDTVFTCVFIGSSAIDGSGWRDGYCEYDPVDWDCVCKV